MRTKKKLDIPNLYVEHIKVSSYSYCEVRTESKNELVYRFNNPISKITDFIKLFNETLNGVNWDVNKYDQQHYKAVTNMLKKVRVNEQHKYEPIQ